MFDTFEDPLKKKLEGGHCESQRIHPEPPRRHLFFFFFFLLESEHQIAVQMQFRLFSFALIVLNCMEYSNCQAPSHRWRRSKRGKTVQEGVGGL